MSVSNNDPPEGENISFNDRFLTDIKIWQKRLRLERPIIVLIILILVIIIEVGWIIIMGWPFSYSIYPETAYALDAFVIANTTYFVWVGFKITKKFPKLLIDNKEFFESEEIFKKYIIYVRDTFRSKKEFYIPIIFAVIGSIINILYYMPLPFNGIWFVILIVRFIIILIFSDIIFLLTISGIILISLTFKCLNRLGTKEYPLHVSYKELKMGGFYDLGKFIMSLTIPGILMGTLTSTVGLVSILLFGAFFIGYVWIIVGIIINLTFIIILYKNTMNIHKSIVKYKSELKAFLLREIEKYTRITSSEVDYHKIHDIHEYYDKIDAIYDWPINPTTFKKLVITLSSTYVPLVLSLFGFI